MTGFQPRSEVSEYTIPEGCPGCGADLPVRVSEKGAMSVCTHCHWMGRPVLTVTHRGLSVEVKALQA
ncbi:hypothetical protein POL68_15595 [Stigmatella sp. ncwal1]|uniref:Uncharacterized protein n=1 Tax=Stigmatella ashevillensis TaxID=2995309 RepID=A0ABT5D8A8_9BACT|nr:hypothetical protein [Stigmatella ashevillena]MDC0709897.1 hypothetical protein [Stigmatella ashevillena]